MYYYISNYSPSTKRNVQKCLYKPEVLPLSVSVAIPTQRRGDGMERRELHGTLRYWRLRNGHRVGWDAGEACPWGITARCLLGRHRWALVITSQRAEWKRPWVMTRGGGRHTRFQSDWCHKHNASLQFQETVTSYKKSKSCLHCENKMREDGEREREEMKCLHDLKYQNIEL